MFDLRRVHAFSRTTAFTAISLIALVYLWLGNVAFLSQNTILIFVLGSLLVAGALAFTMPLAETHRVLAAEKRRLMLENARLMEATTAELRRRIDADDLTGMDNVYKTLHSLEIEHQSLYRAPTWPWHPEAPRAVAAALFFSILLWLVQRILERTLGG